MGAKHGWDVLTLRLPVCDGSGGGGEGAEGRPPLRAEDSGGGRGRAPEMSLTHEEELAVVRQELADKRREHEEKERGAHPRIVDEDRYMVGLLRLEKDIRELVAEEERLKQVIEEEE